jgi:hypothetical protein
MLLFWKWVRSCRTGFLALRKVVIKFSLFCLPLDAFVHIPVV